MVSTCYYRNLVKESGMYISYICSYFYCFLHTTMILWAYMVCCFSYAVLVWVSQVLWWPLTSAYNRSKKRGLWMSVHSFVRNIREQRNYMVQTEVSFTQVVGQPSQTPPLSLICCHLHPLTFLHTLAIIHIHPFCPLGSYCVWGLFLCPEWLPHKLWAAERDQ